MNFKLAKVKENRWFSRSKRLQKGLWRHPRLRIVVACRINRRKRRRAGQLMKGHKLLLLINLRNISTACHGPNSLYTRGWSLMGRSISRRFSTMWFRALRLSKWMWKVIPGCWGYCCPECFGKQGQKLLSVLILGDEMSRRRIKDHHGNKRPAKTSFLMQKV